METIPKHTAPTYVRNVNTDDIILGPIKTWNTSDNDTPAFTANVYNFSKLLTVQTPWLHTAKGSYTPEGSAKESIVIDINNPVAFGNNISKENNNNLHVQDFTLFIDKAQARILELFRHKLMTVDYVAGADTAVSSMYRPGYGDNPTDTIKLSYKPGDLLIFARDKKPIDPFEEDLGNTERYTYTRVSQVPSGSTVKTIFTISSVHLIDNTFVFSLYPKCILIEQSNLQVKRIPGFVRKNKPETATFG